MVQKCKIPKLHLVTVAPFLVRRSQNSFSYSSNLSWFFGSFPFPFSSRMLQVMGLVLVFTHKFGKKKESRSYSSFHYQIIIPVASYTFGWAGRVSQSPLPVLPANPSCCVGGSKWLWSKGSPAWIHREIKWIYSSLYQDISEEGFVLLIEWASPFVPRQFYLLKQLP